MERDTLMTDRELLELAAKSAGITWDERFCCFYDGRLRPWNPLTDDGDALRLAVKLKLIVTFADGGAGPHVCAGRRLGPFSNERLPVKMFALAEELAVTRRAIVRAAASLVTSGESGKE